MRWKQNTEEKIYQATDKNGGISTGWAFWSHFEFHIMGWGCYKWNNAVLSLQYNKKYEPILLSSKASLKAKINPNQTHVFCVYRRMVKLCSYILYISISLTNVIEEKHHSRKGVQSFTMEFYQVYDKSYL